MSFRNLSTPDRVFRIVLGLTMLFVGWSGLVGGLGEIALRVFAWVPIGTGLIGWCPIYALLGFSTRRPRPPRPQEESPL